MRTYRVPKEKRSELVAFLRRAIPLYEGSGGIRIGVYESLDDPEVLLEVTAYAHESDYREDQQRLELDSKLRTLMKEWGALADGKEMRRLRRLL